MHICTYCCLFLCEMSHHSVALFCRVYISPVSFIRMQRNEHPQADRAGGVKSHENMSLE